MSEPTPEPDPVAAQAPGLPGPTDAAVNQAAPWRAAWPVPGGVYVAQTVEVGRLLSDDGLVAAPAGTACEGGMVLPASGALWVGEGPLAEATRAPMVSAALVERAAWRLAEVLEPTRKGIVPGVDAIDPALHQGIRVRSVRKVRRQGAPWQVVIGERQDQIAVALTDRDATALLAGLVVQRTSSEPLELRTLPEVDLDGDGEVELAFAGDGPTGGLRLVLDVELLSGGLTLRTFEEGKAPAGCGVAP